MEGNRLNERFLRFVFAVLLLIGVSAPSVTDAAASTVTIRYLGRGSDYERSVYEEVIKEFMALNPNIRVELLWVSGSAPEIYQQVLLSTAAGVPPDVYWAHTYSIGDLHANNLMLPIDKYVSAAQLRDYFPASLEEFRRNGKLYGLPRESSTLVLFYRTDWFDQAGVPYPNEAWNWDNLLDAAKKLTRRESAKVQWGLSAPIGNDAHLTLLWQNGGRFLDEARRKSLLSSPESIETAEWIWRLMYELEVAPPRSVSLTDAAMMYNIRGVVPTLNAAGIPWATTLVPSGRARYNRLASAGHSVHAATKHPEAAVALLNYLSGPRGVRAFAASGITVPPMRSVGKELFMTPREVVFYQAMEYARPEPVTPRYFEVLALKNQAMDRIWRNEVAIRATLEDLDRRVNALLNEVYGT